jgi:alkaline phosphatase D
VTWDDHEVANDYADVHPAYRNDGRGFVHRRAAAYQAYFEHQPLRGVARPDANGGMLLYRRLTYGDIAEFSVLDTRQYRFDQPCGHGETPRCDAGFEFDATITGHEQERWLFEGLEASGARWNVIAQQVMMGELKHDAEDTDSPTVATEFVGTSISSNGDGPVYGPYYGPMVSVQSGDQVLRRRPARLPCAARSTTSSGRRTCAW